MNSHGFEVDDSKPYLTFRALYNNDFSLTLLPEHVNSNNRELRLIAQGTLKHFEHLIKQRALAEASNEFISDIFEFGGETYVWEGTPRASYGYFYANLKLYGGKITMDEVKMRKELGLEVLTGEADRTSSGRMLCDIPLELASELAEFLGLSSVETHPGWNNPQHRSVMLPHALIIPFVEWCARRRGFWSITIAIPSNHQYTFTKDLKKVEQYKESALRCYILPPIEGETRNVHQMSGRVV